MSVIMAVTLLTIGHYDQRQAIKRGAAYYHPQTGSFTWATGNVFLKGAE